VCGGRTTGFAQAFSSLKVTRTDVQAATFCEPRTAGLNIQR